MIPQCYRFSHRLCLNNSHQIWLIGNQRDQVPPFRYINHAGKVYCLVRVKKVLGDMKYIIRSVKRAAEAV